MYGYIRPEKGSLRIREYYRYRAVYCGLCEALRRRFGFGARFLVNYDLTFLALLLAGEGGGAVPRRCPVHPLRKRLCLCGDPALALTADCCVLLAFEKAEDDRRDEPFWKSLPARLARPFLRHWYKKAADARPELAKAVRRSLDRLAALERAGCALLDETADCFASLLGGLAAEVPQAGRRRALEQLLYHTGRSVYILDAVDDLAEDGAQGRYNPLLLRFSLPEGKLDDGAREALRSTLELSRKSMEAALALLPADQWSPIVSNVVTEGLPAVTELVFSGQWRHTKKKADGGLV